MLLYITILLPLASLHVSSAVLLSDTLLSSRQKRDAASKVDLEALKDNLASIEDGLSNFQKRSCAVGLNSHHCAIANLDRMMLSRDYLSSGFSPGKRSTVLPDDVRSRAEELLHNLSEQTKAVKTLRSLLETMGQQEKKRTCAIRLGNHCMTEALDRAASQYYYLQSGLSPGRRRRDASQQMGLEDVVDQTRRR